MSPMKNNERILAVDMMRGVAILGIFLVNMPVFFSPVLYAEKETLSKTTLDLFAERFIDIVAQANFYTLFSFLFGFGAIMIRNRTEVRKEAFIPLFTRRLIILFLFGLIHAFLIWHGDILLTYAVTGIFILVFYKMKPPVLLPIALGLWIIPNMLITFVLMKISMSGETIPVSKNEAMIEASVANYGHGSFIDILSQNLADWLYTNNMYSAPFLMMSVLPLFMFGMYVAQKGWFVHIDKHENTLRKLMIFTFMVGVPLKWLPYIVGQNNLTEWVQNQFGGPLMATFYAAFIALFSQTYFGKKIMIPLAYVGKMSLSNYLFQSILCSLLFYNYGIGLYGSISPFVGILLTIIIYNIQVLISYIWMTYYYSGPIEWLWRVFMYQQEQPFRRK